MTPQSPRTRFDPTTPAVVVERLTVTDRQVVEEARRWTTGARGAVVEDPGQLSRADLSAYVTEALCLGAHALSVTGQTQETRALELMLREVGEKTAASTAHAAEMTEGVVRSASTAITTSASEARTAITAAQEESRKGMTAVVSTAKRELNEEVGRLFGGERPELLDRLQPVLDRFASSLDGTVSKRTTELLEKAAKQFDPTDPSSPMARHAADLGVRQERLAEQLTRQHAELAGKVEELTTAMKVQEARTSLARVTPIKGDTYAQRIHLLMHSVAAGLGDEYADTGSVVGRLPRCKKGDGLLTVGTSDARVALEMTDSARPSWTDYLEEAERNRAAAASLGLVRTTEQNAGSSIRVLGGRRIVLAFDPETDDPELLRTVVILLRTAAITATFREGTQEIATAQERIADALAQLNRVDTVKKAAASIARSATTIDSECTSLNAGVRRLLDQALAALAGAETAAPPAAVFAARDDGAA